MTTRTQVFAHFETVRAYLEATNAPPDVLVAFEDTRGYAEWCSDLSDEMLQQLRDAAGEFGLWPVFTRLNTDVLPGIINLARLAVKARRVLEGGAE